MRDLNPHQISYAMAWYVDGDTGEICFVIPDLGVDVVAQSRAEALAKRSIMIRDHLKMLADIELEPPAPKPVEELKALHPSLADWEWSIISVP